MATLWLINPGCLMPGEIPPALQLLNHSIEQINGPDASLRRSSADIIVIDARADLNAARSFAQELASYTHTSPILLLVNATALSVISVDWGIDDFVLAEASPAEFEARIRLLLASCPEKNMIVSSPVAIDEDAYIATVGGRQLDLTYTEFELLKCMALHPDHVLTREFLLSEVWGYDYFGGTRTVDVHIRRLRAKLGPEYDSCIATVRNVGYRFHSSTDNSN